MLSRGVSRGGIRVTTTTYSTKAVASATSTQYNLWSLATGRDPGTFRRPVRFAPHLPLSYPQYSKPHHRLQALIFLEADNVTMGDSFDEKVLESLSICVAVHIEGSYLAPIAIGHLVACGAHSK